MELLCNSKLLNMKIIIKINSLSSAITNSSSEVFLIKSERPSEEVKKMIIDYGKSAFCDYCCDLGRLPKIAQDIIGQDKIDKIYEVCDFGSGMGGELDVYDYHDGFERSCGNYETIKDFVDATGMTEEELSKYVIVDIDIARNGTINFILKNFECITENICTRERLKLYDKLTSIILHGIPVKD